MIKFEKIQPGQVLYDVKVANWRQRWGSDHKYSTWPVYVRSIDSINRTVVASCNGNKDQVMSEQQITKYRAKDPNDKK